jgi:hypothetical protein
LQSAATVSCGLAARAGGREVAKLLRLLIVLAVLGLAAPAQARITRLEILRTEPAFGGTSFDNTGAYEHVVAVAHGEVDPADPANTIIQDINLAPRNARGMVEYETAGEMLKPADMARGNRVLLFEVNNRGNKLAVINFDVGVQGGFAEFNALTSPGDGFLMREGYAIVWWGWEMDANPGMDRLRIAKVIAHNPDGSAILGVVRSEMVTPVAAASMPISLSYQLRVFPPDSYDSYSAASLDNRTPGADGFLPSLTVRLREQDPRMPIPNSEWSFATCAAGQMPVPDEKHVCLTGDFGPGGSMS